MSSSFNVILFGGVGVGKSSVINLIAGREVAPTSPELWGCTVSCIPYTFLVDGQNFTIWDTPGVEEPRFGGTSYLPPIRLTYDLIRSLETRGGVDLLLFCFRGNHITSYDLSTYRLFYEVFCRSQVPIAGVVTHLDKECNLEDWWVRREREGELDSYGLKFADHACVTALPQHPKTMESQDNIKRMLAGHEGTGKFMMPRRCALKRLVIPGPLSDDLKPKEIVKILVKRCLLAQSIAEEIATMISMPSPSKSLSQGHKVQVEYVGGQHAVDRAHKPAPKAPVSSLQAKPFIASSISRTHYPLRTIADLDTLMTIREIIHQVTIHLPSVLIDTSSGHLHDRAGLQPVFECSPLFHQLVKVCPNQHRIEFEVKRYFEYAILSHRWAPGEPSYQQVKNVAVRNLGNTPTHHKLKMFCKIVQDAGYQWAWSDTCCIDKQDRPVRDQSLVAMFKWYSASAVVIVYLPDAQSPGDLVESIWNKRAWTLQEYVAGKVVRFYNEDWTLYRGLDMPNHKESQEIMSEMARSTGVSMERLKALRPGLSNIREKLRLASTRQSTEVEDSAYSLFGIFAVSDLQPNYGEGEDALGRFLGHVLSKSGDVNILAWTGESSAVNSCLPVRIAVYSQPETSYLPLRINNDKMEKTIAELYSTTNRRLLRRNSALDLRLAVQLYDHLDGLPMASFAEGRIKLPCIALKLPSFSQSDHPDHYYAQTSAFGTMEIETKWDLAHRQATLYIVHPWLDALLGRSRSLYASSEADDMQPFTLLGAGEHDHGIRASSPVRADTLADPKTRERRALELVARLRQPFGALLFKLTSIRGQQKFGRRVASDALIRVQVQGDVPLKELYDSVEILNIM